MNNILEYKGYFTKVEFSADDNILYGKIEGIRDLVTFECEDVKDLEKEFHEAVDDYLSFCADIGQEPNKTYSGSFNVRIPPELHRAAAMAADREGVKLNAYVKNAIQDKVEGRTNRETVMMVPLESMTKYYETAATQTFNRRVEYGN